MLYLNPVNIFNMLGQIITPGIVYLNSLSLYSIHKEIFY